MRNRTLCRVCAGSLFVFALAASASADITHVIWSKLVKPIHLAPVNGGPITTIGSFTILNVKDLEYDPVSRKIYFLDLPFLGIRGLRRINPDGTGVEMVVTIPNNVSSSSIALDPVARKVYYVIKPNSTTFQVSIRRADMDALDSNIEILITGEQFADQLQLDVVRNVMYWRTFGVKMAPLNGGVATTLIPDNFKFTIAGVGHCFRGPGAIALDKSTGLLYTFSNDGRADCRFGDRFFGIIGFNSVTFLLKTQAIPQIDDIVFDHMAQQIYYTMSQSPDIGRFDLASLQLSTAFTSPGGGDAQFVSVAHILPTPCAGDANADGSINFGDVTTILANWLASSCPAGSGSCGIEGVQGDANDDGQVNFGDITAVLAQWQGGCP